MNTGFSEEEGDWESNSDDDDDNDHELESTEIKKAKPTEDDVISGELEGLKETAELYKSNIFKLEIDELLTEIAINYEKHKTLEKALHNLKAIFDSIPNGKSMKLHEFAEDMLKKNKIVTPFPDPQPAKDALHPFAFEKPTSMHIVGGYGLKTIAKSKKPFNVDVAVEMPSTIFQEKDYANYRYFHKRACYLAVLASALQSSKKFDIEYSILNGDFRRPILLVKPIKGKPEIDFSKTKCVIRILPCVDSDVFPLQRLAPGKSCVKPAEATPHYNASLLMDTAYTGHLAFLYQHIKSSQDFKNAVLLARTWIHQRGLTAIGFTPFLFSMLMAYLIQGNKDGMGKKLSSSHSSYQLLRGTLDFISTHDFSTSPIFLGENEKEGFSSIEFQKAFDVVIVDPSGTLNLAANMTISGLKQVQHEARLAMNFFNDSTDRFEELFLKNVNDAKLKYDNVMHISFDDIRKAPISKFDESAKADHYHYLPYFVNLLSSILNRGLTNRVDLVAVHYEGLVETWPITKALENIDEHVQITVGLLLNSDNAPRLVDQGPDATQTEAIAEFRKFWGSKSELRRFKDGSIVESVVWQTQGYENRTLIVQKICLYLLELHLKLQPSQVIYWAGQLYSYLNYSKALPNHLFHHEELKISGFQTVMSAFNQFSKQLRQIDDALPLLINNIYPAHASLRYSSATLPHPVDFNNMISYPTTARYFDAIDVVVHIERSAKFPDDLNALQKVKHAFYLKMSEELKSRFQVDSVVVDDIRERNPLAIRGYLDVYYMGYLFRCHIHLEQEATLLQKIIDSKTTTDLNKRLAKEALTKYMYQLRYKQTHTFYIQAMCARFTAYSTTVRLVKRWFGCHLLSPHVTEEMIELIAAHVFLEPQPWSTPTSTFVGFGRVLHLLATWDWATQPLIVDIEGDLTSKQRETIIADFNQQRRVNPQMTVGAMTIATAKDLTGHRWFNSTRAIAARITALARASLQVFTTTNTPQDLKRIFVTPLEDYSVVLDLDRSNCTRYYQNLHPEPYAMKMRDDDGTPYAQLDPVTEFIAELKKLYGQTLLVFHNAYGGDQLALVWNPLKATPIQWKVNAGYNCVPVDMNKNGFLKPAKGQNQITKMIQPNFNAILAEIRRLGQGILKQED
ncbi:Nrap protein [Cokeromyces recurvatus]|uniref:Nrap protein n=1 Tax=Cokeromyces recurvatus TaxID=90255 RepID=UPI00221E407D|nr:Nrap protein [Cokeromyces recurvatus]KAI7906247.1 Nrap protein [Cokeromyces recurvatus]